MWRAKKFSIPAGGGRRLVVTFRKFKTAEARRSKKFKQLVLPCPLGKVREVSFYFHRFKKRRLNFGQRLLLLAQPSLVLLGAVGIIFFSFQLFSAKTISPPQTFTISKTKAASQKTVATQIKPLPASVPTGIDIPSVNIDVNLVPVGKDAAGAIAMPPFSEWVAGWYKYSPTPGQIGPAVIVGHLDTETSTSVFWDLRYVKPGALIYISRADGSKLTFKVTELEQVSQTNFPTEAVYGNINYPGLRVITCGGTYNPDIGRYSQNTVVYAALTSPS